jgi:redox-sensitive bicupin YhaK (pirin superfamily)
MSWQPASEPQCLEDAEPTVDLVIQARVRDLGGFSVRRVLPSPRRRLVGPFIFWDHMGPVEQPPGQGMDVRPHPHINLATVTYLFEGEIFHRDSLGSAQAIRPGDVNWMTAGSGIVHSERTPPEERAKLSRLHGIQAWVALPREREEVMPSFRHHPRASLPKLSFSGVELTVIAGEAYGARSPVEALSPLFYVDARFEPGKKLEILSEYEERAAYVVEGTICCGAERFAPGNMIVFARGRAATIFSEGEARVMLLGGAALEGERHIYWNFVSSSEERIAQAKEKWKTGGFPQVPGDEREFIPLPS